MLIMGSPMLQSPCDDTSDTGIAVLAEPPGANAAYADRRV